MKLRTALSTILKVAVASVALLRLPISAQSPAFHSEINVVQVPVSVRDARGRLIDGLDATDFAVLSDGVRQDVKVDKFETGVAPISLAIAIQTAGILTPALAKIRRIGSLIGPLLIGTSGEAAVISFDDQITVRQDFTSNPDAIEAAFQNLKPGSFNKARMLDTVIETAGRIQNRAGRRILLLISEDRDRGSTSGLEQALQVIARDGLEIFAIHYSAYATTWISKPEQMPQQQNPDFVSIFTELGRLGKTNTIKVLTRETGGMNYSFLRERGMESAIQALGEELRSQYLLSFSPENALAGLHRIDVTVPRLNQAHVQSRRVWWIDGSNN